MRQHIWKGLLALSLLASEKGAAQQAALPTLKIAPGGRYFMTADREPFFWLGDTGWLLFGKLTREEAEQYLEKRKQQGFNVVQVMVLHTLGVVNAYGDTAIAKKDVSKPIVTAGNNPADQAQYDYWDHVDYIIDLATQKGIYMALVPVWGSNVKDGGVSEAQGAAYAKWIATRYKNRSNIIWLNGGDIKGTDGMAVWQAIGTGLRRNDPNHLITFHPRGRMQSSKWFHNAAWLDFNMFQSGHRRYDQDTSKSELHYGEDNWRYLQADYRLKPVKPTLDGEPSYEKIPQGLHDPKEPLWNDADVRRYGYWSVFAGGSGYTYGHNEVMQMRKKGETGGAYGATGYWFNAINDAGATQMQYLKQLMLSRPYFERIPDQSLVADNKGERYERLLATRGKRYAFVYSYTGAPFKVRMGVIEGKKVTASWYDPRTGKSQVTGNYANTGVRSFDPPGATANGNDWVLVLDSE